MRGIDRIDEDTRQVWFHAGGKNPDQDPYFIHYYRVNFDGTGLVALTEGNGSHSVQYSPDRRFLIDTYSRVDRPPVHELRRVDGRQAGLQARGGGHHRHSRPAAGSRPRSSSPRAATARPISGASSAGPRTSIRAEKYPVIEQIYAGPQGSFVPKTFSPASRFSSLTDLGFIVVQMDGMGTANRSKAFHDVCWHDIKDAGFPDRILWHQAVAKKYPWYDLEPRGDLRHVGRRPERDGRRAVPSRVLQGGGLGLRLPRQPHGQGFVERAMDGLSGRAVVFRESSNIDNAHRLQGKLLLIVGEMDTNVPPESTMRLVDALIKADKDFELLVVPNANHGMGGAYGQRRMRDFFVRHLLGTEPASSSASPARDVAAVRTDGVTSSAPVVGAGPHRRSPARSTWRTSPTTAASCAVRSSGTRSTGRACYRRRRRRLRRRAMNECASSPRSGWNSSRSSTSTGSSQDGKVDYLLFKNHLSHQLRQLDLRSKERSLAARWSPSPADPRSRRCAARS